MCKECGVEEKDKDTLTKHIQIKHPLKLNIDRQVFQKHRLNHVPPEALMLMENMNILCKKIKVLEKKFQEVLN